MKATLKQAAHAIAYPDEHPYVSVSKDRITKYGADMRPVETHSGWFGPELRADDPIIYDALQGLFTAQYQLRHAGAGLHGGRGANVAADLTSVAEQRLVAAKQALKDVL